MIGFKLFCEALDLKTVRKMKLTRKNSGAYNNPILDSKFKGKDRIRIKENISIKPDASITYDSVRSALKFDNLKVTPESYIENYAVKTDNENVKVKIGKYLQQTYGEHSEIFQKFKNDPFRAISEKDRFDIIVSRHPYDVAGQSTGRHWKSCTRLPTSDDPNGGLYYSYVDRDIESGTIIAYLVRHGDTNIKRPISRVLLKPVYKGIHNTNEKYPKIAYAVGNEYGVSSKDFLNTMTEWVHEFNDWAEGEYSHDPTLYWDGYPNQNIKVDLDSTFWVKDVVEEMFPKNEKITINIGMGDKLFVKIDFPVEKRIQIVNDIKEEKILDIIKVDKEYVEHFRANPAYDSVRVIIDFGEFDILAETSVKKLKIYLYKFLLKVGVYRIYTNYENMRKDILNLFKD